MTQQTLAEPVNQLPRARAPRRWGRVASVLLWLAGALIVLTAFYLWAIFPWMARWGATDAEVRASYPGDDLVANAGFITTRAVTVRATPAQIYPWLVQLGVDRGGMYSLLWVENLMGLHVKNTDRIHEEWQNLQVGDLVRFTPEDYFLNPGPSLWVKQMEKDHALVFCFGMETEMPDRCTDTWQFVLTPQADGTTRLILRSQSAAGEGMSASAGKIFQGLTFIMERAMLLNIRERAEQLALASR
ncbi:MAG: hypothetical protein KF893_06075 [Caldilineaceae bacterium]|nr:hypothetical protein [Caldilineaceae bacterium]